MAITLITTTGLVTGAAHTFSAPGDGFYLAEGVTWGSSDSELFSSFLNNLSATFAGDAISADFGFFLGSDDVSVRITETGSMTSYLQSSATASFYLAGVNGSLVNEGFLSSAQSAGVTSNGGNQIINRGSIDAASAVFLGLFGGTGDTLLNSGTINANGYDDAIQGDRYNNGVYSEGANTTIINLAGGIISAVGTEGAGVRFSSSAGGSVVENYGEIVSVNYYGVSFAILSSGNLATLMNEGLITGSSGAFQGSGNTDTVINRGVMNGDVALEGGNDIFDGRGGVVNGTVSGGTGDDIYTIDDSSIILSEFSTEGTDLVNSSVGWTLGTNFENLALMGSKAIRGIGNGVDNLIIGNDADNRLRGRAGDDVIFGEGGDDNIRGQIGNDVLYGGYGDDIVKGNRGNDTLSGGAGDDLLKGGVGSDRYVFDFNNDGDDTLKDVGGGSDTLAVTGRVMSQLDFRRSGNDLVIESGGTVDRVVIDDFYIAGDAGRIELLETTTTTKYLQTGLTGGATDDIIVGFSGTQIIRGGAGDDILIGKGDKDRIYGGSGADRFDYDALSDSGTTSTTMDTIYDFVAGTDRIDLFDIDADSTTAGNQNFSFIGAGAYSGTAGELRYQFIGGNTQLGVDVDGDMVDDFNILLAGNIAFSAGDFVL